MLDKHFVPTSDVLERRRHSYIKDEDNAMRIFEVGRDQATIPFLASCIPHL